MNDQQQAQPRPICFQPRPLVLAKNRPLFRWYCDKHLQPRSGAVCATDVEEVERLRGLDPDGWEIHIAGEPELMWLTVMTRAMADAGFGAAKLARR
jgi:hypothetical protein